MKKAFLFFLFFFSLFQVSFSNLNPFTILDDVDLNPSYSDTISFQFDPTFYDARTLSYALKSIETPSCSPQINVGDYQILPLTSNNAAQLNIYQDPASSSIVGTQLCIEVKKLSQTIVPFEYYLFSQNPLQVISAPNDLTPPTLLSLQIENPQSSYKKDDTIRFVATFDDTILPNSPSVIFVNLNNNVTVVLNQINGNKLQGDYKVLQNPGEETNDLFLNDITGKVVNIARTEQTSSFPTQTKLLSSSGKIKIVSTNTSPLEISFMDGVESEAQTRDYIQVQVRNELPENLSLKYGFSPDNNCNSVDNFNYTFQISQAIIIDDTSKNGQYICFEISRIGETKSYLGSSNPIKVILSNTLPPPPVIVGTGTTLPANPSRTGSVSPSYYTGSVSTGSLSPVPLARTNSQSGLVSVNLTGAYVPASTPVISTQDTTSQALQQGTTSSESKQTDMSVSQVIPSSNNTPFFPSFGNIQSPSTLQIFNDIEGNFAQTYIEILADKGIISIQNESFNPDSPITRAEFLKLLLKSNSLNYEEQSIESSIFSDTLQNNWQSKVALKSYTLGVTNGYDDKTFRPDGEITRIEAIKFMMKVKGYPLVDSLGTSFIDLPETWMKKYANKAKEIGLINGEKVSFGYLFKPNTPITRGESAKIIAKSLEK